MTDWQQKIEAQIASLRNEGWYATEHTEAAPITEAMQALLDVAVAVDEWRQTGKYGHQLRIWSALDKLREAGDE